MFQTRRNRTHHKLAGGQASRGGSQPGPVPCGGQSPGGSSALSLEAAIRVGQGKEWGQQTRKGMEEVRSSGLQRWLCSLSFQPGQLQTNRVRATVAPLPMTSAPGRAPKIPAASKASAEAFLQLSEEEEETEGEGEEDPSGLK